MVEKIITYLEKQIGNPELKINPEDDLLTSGLLDSIGMMQLIGYIESEWSIQIPPEDLTIDNFLNVAEINNYLINKGIDY